MSTQKIDREAIRSLALRHGFTLRQQADGEMDLHEYVYAFAQEVFQAGIKAAREADCAGAGHAKQQEAEEAAAPTYSCSTDGETFYGTFATPEEAAADYLREGDDDSSVEVGRNERRTAHDYVGKYHIESLLEMVSENAYEECGDCAESWLSDMTKDDNQLKELKQVVGDWIQRNEPPGFWHVEDIRRITRSELIASGHLVQPSEAGGGK